MNPCPYHHHSGFSNLVRKKEHRNQAFQREQLEGENKMRIVAMEESALWALISHPSIRHRYKHYKRG
jgi:hypothetical protein